MRKSAGFDIADRIVTYYQGDAYVTRIMESYGDYIRHETLSQNLENMPAAENAYREDFKLEQHPITLAVRRV